MKKFFSLLVLTSVLLGTIGCGNKKKNKAAVEQKQEVVKHFVQEEQAADKKEDYSIVA